MNNDYKTIGYNSDSYLDRNGILGSIQNFLILRCCFAIWRIVRPTIFFVRFCNFKNYEILGTGKKYELTFFFLITVSYKFKCLRILLLRQITCQFYFWVSKYILWYASLPFNNLVLQVCLASDYIERTCQMYSVEFLKRLISSV